MLVEFRSRFPFEHVPPSSDPALDAMAARWADLLGLDPARLDCRADREDWVENAVQLVAAAEAGLPVAAVAPARRSQQLTDESVRFAHPRP